jgi:hypothetical protein
MFWFGSIAKQITEKPCEFLVKALDVSWSALEDLCARRPQIHICSEHKYKLLLLKRELPKCHLNFTNRWKEATFNGFSGSHSG